MTQYFQADPSLFQESKLGNLMNKQREKADRILTAPEPAYIPETRKGFIEDMMDLGQSSFYTEVGLDLDLTKNALNAALGTDFDPSRESGFSNRQLADQQAGLNRAVRTDLQEGQREVLTSVAEGNYGEAVLSALNVAFPTAADSAGSIMGLAAGLATSKGVGAIAGIKRKYNKALDTLDEYKTIKASLKVAGAISKNLSETSFIVASQTQRKIHDYQEANNGEMPSGNKLMVMGVGTAITMSANPLMLRSLYLPNRKKRLTEIRSLVRTMKPDTSGVASIARRVREGITKIGVTGGAEGVQEYIQTWDELLSVKVNPENGQTLFQAVMEQVHNKENQDEAITGGILGSVAGGAIKSVGVVPTVGVGAAVDTSVGAIKATHSTTKGIVTGIANRSARNKLSQEERRDLNTQFQAEKQIADQEVLVLNKQRKTINKSKNLEDLMSNEDIAPLVTAQQQAIKMSDEQANTPAGFKQLKKALDVTYSKSIDTVKGTLDDSNLSNFKSRTGKPSKTATKEASTESINTLASQVEPLGEPTVKAVKELETQLAVDIVNKINKDPENVTEGLTAAAKELSIHDLERAAAITQEINPEASNLLSKLANKKVNAIKRFTPSKDKVVNSSNIDSQLLHTAKEGITSDTHIPFISAALSSAMGKKIGDSATVDTLQKVISNYAKSGQFKKQGKGVIHPTTLKKWTKRLASLEEELKTKEGTKPKTEEKVEPKTESSAKATEPKSDVKISGKLDALIKPISENITSLKNSEEGIGPILEQMPKLTEILAKQGYNTKEKFDAFIKQYPGFGKDPEILNALKLAMYDPDIKEAPISTVKLTDKQMNEAYTKLFPGCKI